jgi:hypothetical protein
MEMESNPHFDKESEIETGLVATEIVGGELG